MRRWNRKIVAWLGVGLLFVAGWANAQEAPLSSTANPMDRVVALRLEGDVLLRQALDSIGESVGLKFTLDTRVLAGWLAEGEEPRFSAPTGRRKVSEHLERLLGPEGLVAVYLDGTWLVTAEDRAFHLQMRQKVDLDWKDRSLEKCLEELAESKKINLVVDPRKIGVGRSPVTLRLRERPWRLPCAWQPKWRVSPPSPSAMWSFSPLRIPPAPFAAATCRGLAAAT
ncbi:MAG: hypothetical protein ACKOS8_00670 [Gemmataceae bacterium]